MLSICLYAKTRRDNLHWTPHAGLTIVIRNMHIAPTDVVSGGASSLVGEVGRQVET